MILTTRPIDVWPRPEPRHRGHSPFGSTYSATRSLLDRELRMLNARNCVLQIDVREQDLRLDGELRAAARPQGPRVALAFDSKHGPLRYYCDRWNNWQDNLRGIALGLEAQRKLERYGITTRGEQYTGWKALGAGIAMGPASMSVEQARSFIEQHSGLTGHLELATNDELYRLAAKQLHPDQGGDEELFKRLVEAKRILDESGTF